MDDLDEWLELENGLENDARDIERKRPLKEIDHNVMVQGEKRFKPAPQFLPDEDELLSYLQEEPVSASDKSRNLHNFGSRLPSEKGAASTHFKSGEGTKTASPVQRSSPQPELRHEDFLTHAKEPCREESGEGSCLQEDEDDCIWPQRDPLNIEGDAIPVTSYSGERVYCSLRPAEEPCSASTTSSTGRIGCLLSQSWEELKLVVEERMLERAILQTKQEETAKDASPETQDKPEAVRGRGGLWVERYAPRSFFDLLSDETINREVVRWLKSWDACVFRHGTAKAHSEPQAARGGVAAAAPHAGVKGDRRPEHKVLLLCGAPGLGKTTLAHVVARHCGYRPLELNASDSRTAEGLHNWLADAAQTHSVTGDRRPNCIILDEVDGATGGSEGRGTIGTLLKFVNAGGSKAGKGNAAPAKQKVRNRGDQEGDSDDDKDGEGNARPGSAGRDKSGAAGGGTGRRKGGVRPLCRPVIAICNDLYAPALRPLRSVAHVVQFKTPTAERISNRLKAICAAEGLLVDRQALNELLEVTRSDVRACLNALQFLARKTRRVTLASIKALGLASKDVSESAFSAWHQLFTKRRQAGMSTRSDTEGARLLTMLEDMGEADLIFRGIHENMLGLRYMDTHMTRTARATSHVAEADVLLRQCGRRGDFSLIRYLPPVALAVRQQVAGPSRPSLKWPKQQAEAHKRQLTNQDLLRTWHLTVHPSLQCSLTITAAVQEVLPALMHVVCQPLRPVATRLLNPDERQALARLVATLADFSLTFDLRSDATPDGLAAVALIPPVHALCCFSGLVASTKAPARPVQQMICHELQLETIRRRELLQGHSNTDEGKAEAGPSSKQEAQAPPAKPAAIPRTVADRTTAGPVKSVKAEHKKNWLEQLKGRAAAGKRPHVAHNQRQTEQDGAAASTGKGPRDWPVLYKFSQGYTNAVRRPVRIKDLL